MLNLDALKDARTRAEPFTYVVAEGALTPEQAASIRADYPVIDRTGYLPLSQLAERGAFAALMDDLRAPALAGILSDRLSLDLTGKPRMITVRRLSKRSDGRVHNDSEAKICTMLVYLEEAWDPTQGGAIRALNGPGDMDDYAEEVPPVAGNVFAFARSEASWHGHPPFEGERHVVQVTFLQDEAELARKEQRGGVQMRLKRFFGR